MKAAAARLAGSLGQRLPRRPWVTPVVVIWGRWEGAPHFHDGVAWVHGGVLGERLADYAGEHDADKHALVSKALRSLKASGTSAAYGRGAATRRTVETQADPRSAGL